MRNDKASTKAVVEKQKGKMIIRKKKTDLKQ